MVRTLLSPTHEPATISESKVGEARWFLESHATLRAAVIQGNATVSVSPSSNTLRAPRGLFRPAAERLRGCTICSLTDGFRLRPLRTRGRADTCPA